MHAIIAYRAVDCPVSYNFLPNENCPILIGALDVSHIYQPDRQKLFGSKMFRAKIRAYRAVRFFNAR